MRIAARCACALRRFFASSACSPSASRSGGLSRRSWRPAAGHAGPHSTRLRALHCSAAEQGLVRDRDEQKSVQQKDGMGNTLEHASCCRSRFRRSLALASCFAGERSPPLYRGAAQSERRGLRSSLGVAVVTVVAVVAVVVVPAGHMSGHHERTGASNSFTTVSRPAASQCAHAWGGNGTSLSRAVFGEGSELPGSRFESSLGSLILFPAGQGETESSSFWHSGSFTRCVTDRITVAQGSKLSRIRPPVLHAHTLLPLQPMPDTLQTVERILAGGKPRTPEKKHMCPCTGLETACCCSRPGAKALAGPATGCHTGSFCPGAYCKGGGTLLKSRLRIVVQTLPRVQ